MTIKVYLWVKQGLFAMQRSLVCVKTSLPFFAQKRFYPSNGMTVSCLWLHAVFCKIPGGFPFFAKEWIFERLGMQI